MKLVEFNNSLLELKRGRLESHTHALLKMTSTVVFEIDERQSQKICFETKYDPFEATFSTEPILSHDLLNIWRIH